MKLCPHRIYIISMDMKKRALKLIIIALAVLSVFFILVEAVGTKREEKKGAGLFVKWLQDRMLEPYLPALYRMSRGTDEKISSDMYDRLLLAEYPVFLYSMENGELDFGATESDYARLLMLEGSDEDHKAVPEGELEYGEDAMHLEKSLADALLAENGMYLENQEAQPEQEEPEEEQPEQPAEFVPSQNKSYSYRWDDLKDYESLVKAFYAVDSTTKAGEELLSVETLLSKDMRMQGSADNPQILIYHTHSREAFADSAEGDEAQSIVGVGEYLAQILRDRYGYHVLHHTESYDSESRDYAYSNALPAIEKVLAENPSVEVVIDLHRDAMPEEKRLVMNLQGKPTAQFMFFNGLSRTAKGSIDYLENPNLADNLAFSFQMQAACNEYYPGLARRVYLKAYRYNMHVCPKTLLIELGAQNNTLEEAKNACDPLAHVLHLVLSGEEPKR